MTFASSLTNHIIWTKDRRTSIRLEPAFWSALEDLAQERGCDISTIIREVEKDRGAGSLTSAVRVWVLSIWMARGKLGKG